MEEIIWNIFKDRYIEKRLEEVNEQRIMLLKWTEIFGSKNIIVIYEN